MRSLKILGASGHGKVVADIAKKTGYEEILFYDDDLNKKTCGEFQVVGRIDEMSFQSGGDYFVAIGSPNLREDFTKLLLKNDVNVITLIHPNAVVAEGVLIGKGTVIMAGAVINPGAEIGSGCIINTCASVDHDCCVGDYCHISVGSHLAGTVTVGKSTWIGIGASVSNNLTITDNCMIGAGTVVVEDLLISGTYVGTPAKRIHTDE